MRPEKAWTIRPAMPEDRDPVALLWRSASYRHEHLDWIHALDLIGQTPFLLASSPSGLAGCLACPPDIPTVAWVKLLLVGSGRDLSHVWSDLWPAVPPILRGLGVSCAAALPVSEWMAVVLEKAGFVESGTVVFLEWHRRLPSHPSPAVRLRAMRQQDLRAVAGVDHAAFDPVWQLSEGLLGHALAQSEVATVALDEQKVVGYQISTSSALGAHIARLAVVPGSQRRGIGLALVADAVHQLHRRGHERVSVNTQQANAPSLALYSSMGFRRTGQDFPFYRFSL
jgi:ribosomal protein S18 acetylase RimI-like enzyme